MSMEIVVLLCLVQFSSAFFVNVANNTRDESDRIRFHFYQGPSPSDYTTISIPESYNRTLFRPNQNMEFLIPDWTESFINIRSMTDILASAFFQRRNETLVFVDYLTVINERNRFDNPVNIASNINNIANTLASFFRRLIPMMLDPRRAHFICHGSGCPVLSQMARSYRPAQLMWLTGLDPANHFIPPNLSGHLSRADGIFVDIIHTDAGFRGDALSSGTVDFFPNGGSRPQPACHLNNDDCNHEMAWRYYVESITSPTAFPSRRCLRLPVCTIDLYHCPCDLSGNFANMGFGVNRTTARGDYYLQTNNKSPYNEGIGGTTFGTPVFRVP